MARTLLTALGASVVWLLGASGALLLALLLSALLWAAGPHALPQTLGWGQKWLEQHTSQRLSFSGARGNWLQGGEVAQLHWSLEGRRLDVRGLRLGFSWRQLLQVLREQRLALDELAAQSVHWEDLSPASPTEIPHDWQIGPVDLKVPLRVEQLVWKVGAGSEVQVGPVAATYHYQDAKGSPHHKLEIGHLVWAQGQYQGQIQLGAQAPLALQARLTGELRTQVDGLVAQSLQAELALEGELAHANARLQLEAEVQAQGAGASRTKASQLKLKTTVFPWRDWPWGELNAHVRGLDLGSVWPGAPETLLDGQVQAQHEGTSWALQGHWTNRLPGAWSQHRLPLRQGKVALQHREAVWSLSDLQFEGSTGGVWQAQASGAGTRWHLHRLEWRDPQGHRLEAKGLWDTRQQQFSGQGSWDLPGAQGQVDWQPDQGRLVSVWQWSDPKRLPQWLGQHWGPWVPRGAQVAWQTVLERLRDQQGSARVNLDWNGAWGPDRPPAQWSLRAELPQWGPASAEQAPDWQLRQASLQASGQQEQARLVSQGELLWANGSGDWHLESHGELGTSALSLQPDRFKLDLRQPSHRVRLEWPPAGSKAPSLRWQTDQGWEMDAGQADVQVQALSVRNAPSLGVSLAWDFLRYHADRIESSGRVRQLRLSTLNAWLAKPSAPEGPLTQAGLSGDVDLESTWQIAWPLTAAAAQNQAAQVEWTLASVGGDLSLATQDLPKQPPTPIGLKRLQGSLRIHGEELRSEWHWNSQTAGSLDAEFTTRLQSPTASQGWQWPAQAPVQGFVKAGLPQLGLWSSWIPPGWRMQGAVEASARLEGKLSDPSWNGDIKLHRFSVRSLLHGLDFSEGEVRARLNGRELSLESLRLQGAGGAKGGWLLGQGTVRWERGPAQTPQGLGAWEPKLDLELEAQQLRLLARADRRLTVSGKVHGRLQQNVLELKGRLQALQALFVLAEDDRPTLGDDVQVHGRRTIGAPVGETGGGPTPLAMRVQLALDLGPDFQLKGQGLESQLTGEVLLQTQVGQAPRLTGQIQTAQGRYQSWGQTLSIETGTLSFNGPYDNPTLDILALRPLTNQRVGVQITGSALAPRLRLYADPELPETEKLAWLVLGRPGNSNGAEAALLQQTALTLVSSGGKNANNTLKQALGLDEFSLRNESMKNNGVASPAAITLGKRLSDRLYLSYSRSVMGIAGTVGILYDLSRSLSLRAQAGDDSGVELLFTHKYDSKASLDKRGKSPEKAP